MTLDPSSPAAAPVSDAAADRIDAYINSVEQVLIAAAVPAAERVQVLGDLETQITEMLNNEQLPITDSTVEAVIARLEPPSHFAAAYGPPSSAAVANPISTLSYNRLLVAAAVSCAFFLLMCLLLVLLAGPVSSPPLMRSILALLLLATIATPVALRHGVAQLRAQSRPQRGRQLALATTIVYYTVAPLLVLLSACALTDGYILFPIALGSFAYVQYVLIGRLCRHITGEVPDQDGSGSLGASLRGFARAARPATSM